MRKNLRRQTIINLVIVTLGCILYGKEIYFFFFLALFSAGATSDLRF